MIQARTATKLGAFVTAVVFLVLFLDNHYEVLPSAIHNRLPLHHPGFVITDITVRTCSSLNPLRSCTLNPRLWDRIDKNLYLDQSWTAGAYLHIRRRQEEDIGADDKVVLDITVGKNAPPKDDRIKNGAVWESRAEGIWVLRSPKRRQVDSHQAVTSVDVLFGPDAVDPRPGWTLRSTPLLINSASADLEPHITFRSGSPHTPERPILKIRPNGKFKIMQVADLHLSTGLGICRDPEPPTKHCEADPRTLDFIGKLLDQEQPDLVVLSGDQVNGETAPDVQSAIFKFADLFVKRKIPYATIFGNHDDESSWSRSTSMILLEQLPYSLSQHGPTNIAGVGNYVLEVEAPGGSTHAALSLYLLDTHTYSPNERQFHGYDWLKDDQIQWFRKTAQNLKTKHKKYMKIHMDMAFIHIPLPEYRHEHNRIIGGWREGVTAPNFNSGFRDALVEEGVLVVSAGHDHANDYCSLERETVDEPVQAGVDVKMKRSINATDTHTTTATEHKSLHKRAGLDAHMTPRGKKKSPRQHPQSGTIAASIMKKPSAISSGSSSGKPALWMCYGGGSGFGGYGGYPAGPDNRPYVRRVRFFEIETNGATITSWKRLEHGDTERRVDESVLVSQGRVADL